MGRRVKGSPNQFDQWCARVSLGAMESLHTAARRQALVFERETGHSVQVVYPAAAPPSGAGHVAREMLFMCLSLDSLDVHVFSARNPGKPPTIHLLSPAEQLQPRALSRRGTPGADVPSSGKRELPASGRALANEPPSGKHGPVRPTNLSPLTSTAPMTAEELSQPVSSAQPQKLSPASSRRSPLTGTSPMLPSSTPARAEARAKQQLPAMPLNQQAPDGAAPGSRSPASLRDVASLRVTSIPLCQVVPTQDGGFVLFKARSTEERVKLDDIVFRVFEELVNRWRRMNG